MVYSLSFKKKESMFLMTDVISLLPHLEADSLRGFMCSVFPSLSDTMGQCIGSCLYCVCSKNNIAHCFTTAPKLLI